MSLKRSPSQKKPSRLGMKRARKRKPWKPVLIVVFVFVIALIFWDQAAHRFGESGSRQQKYRHDRQSAGKAGQRGKQRTSLASKQRGEVVVIIDDIGGDLAMVKELLQIRAPIAFAVLPNVPHSREAAVMIHQARREVLLHLPMEPEDYPRRKPGAGAVFADMPLDEIRRRLKTDIEAVPHICGVNNHMGSFFMKDRTRLKVVFEELKKKGLFFIDSRTTPFSCARELAAEMKLTFAERKNFIDNDNKYAVTLARIMEAGRNSKVAEERKTIMIGHPYPATVEALRKAVPLLKKENIHIVAVKKLLRE